MAPAGNQEAGVGQALHDLELVEDEELVGVVRGCPVGDDGDGGLFA